MTKAEFKPIKDPETNEVIGFIGDVPGYRGYQVVGGTRQEVVDKLKARAAYWQEHPGEFWRLNDGNLS